MREDERFPLMEISIHAPARGATVWMQTLMRITKFQSTLPRGERRTESWPTHSWQIFQSTLPRGERRRKRDQISQIRNFNPRSREGSDKSLNNLHFLSYHFNPRSREGSDVHLRLHIDRLQIFQSTLPRGERQFCIGFFLLMPLFQSTLPRGERRLISENV